MCVAEGLVRKECKAIGTATPPAPPRTPLAPKKKEKNQNAMKRRQKRGRAGKERLETTTPVVNAIICLGVPVLFSNVVFLIPVISVFQHTIAFTIIIFFHRLTRPHGCSAPVGA